MKRLFYLIIFLVFALFAFTLNLKNPDTIQVSYYFNILWELPLFLVIMIPFFTGMLLGVLLMGLSVFKTKRQVGKTNKQLKKVEKEVESLRAMPLTERSSEDGA